MNRDVSKQDFFSTIVFGIFCIFLSIYAYYGINTIKVVENNSVNIILSPHFDDGVLSLGGMLQKSKSNTLVVTFLAEVPNFHERTKWDRMSGFTDDELAVKDRIAENNHALALIGVSQDNLSFLDYQYRNHSIESHDILKKKFVNEIESIIAKYKDKIVYIYGPSIFGPDLTHPDHRLLHDAFVDVINEYRGNKSIIFYFYEDFPYVYGYNHRNNPPLIDTLKSDSNLNMNEIYIPLDKNNVYLKKMAISLYPSQVKAFDQMSFNVISESEKFMSHRCMKANIEYCEVVYKVIK